MASTSHSILIKASIAKVYKAVTDFESYPKIFPEVKEAKIIKRAKGSVVVEFLFNIIVSIRCKLKFVLKPKNVSWSLIEGDFMHSNDGVWELKEQKGGTFTTYTVEIEPTMWVPKAAIEQLLNSNAPQMIKNLKKKCER